ncbi:unnamed protein product [Litomosoides sigmodontis]|uniref:Uncharacterized protein n=1 Tax=Litomosoides sigmodontis TaxID=42156 RepID=A0A3P7KDU2_LITSI|nr:unnamed protein product [Litomosoides sigmodontis]
MHDIFTSFICMISSVHNIEFLQLDEEFNDDDDESIQSLMQRHRLEMEMLRERQRRELQVARLRLRHNQLSNGNILLAAVGGGLAGSVDGFRSSLHSAIQIPYHSIVGSNITSRFVLPSSISLPGSPPQHSFLGQHLAPLRDIQPRRACATSFAESTRHTSVDATLSRRSTHPLAHPFQIIGNSIDQHRQHQQQQLQQGNILHSNANHGNFHGGILSRQPVPTIMHRTSAITEVAPSLNYNIERQLRETFSTPPQ